MHVFQQTVYTYEDDSTCRLLENQKSPGSVEAWKVKSLRHVTTHLRKMRTRDVATLNSWQLLQTVNRNTTMRNTILKKVYKVPPNEVMCDAKLISLYPIFITDLYVLYNYNGTKFFVYIITSTFVMLRCDYTSCDTTRGVDRVLLVRGARLVYKHHRQECPVDLRTFKKYVYNVEHQAWASVRGRLE